VERPAVLYDSDCGFCRASVALILAWDRRRRLRPLSLQEPEARRLLPGMDDEERMSSWHLALPDGQVRSAGAAFEPMLRELPGGAPLAALAGRFPDAVERGYRWVTDRRSTLGRALPAGLKQRADVLIASRTND
jgi:predicted DCC family thiol-disulfide oxidoreductase YuxK